MAARLGRGVRGGRRARGRGLLDGEASGFQLELEEPGAVRDREALDPTEIAGFVDTFMLGDPAADLNHDGVIDLADVVEAVSRAASAR